MKVGIISKEAHAKSHAAALEEAGFLPVMLGSNPSEIPTTIPLVVCRTLSCAHGGMDTALAWSRAGNGRLIVENGVKVMLKKALRHRSEVEGARNPGTGFNADPVSGDLSENAHLSVVSYEDLLEAAQVLADGRPDDTYEVLGVVSTSYAPHQYEDVLLKQIANIIDDSELAIGSAGLLKGGAIAWVQIEMPENLKVADVEFRPHLLATTSFNGSIATTYKRCVTVVVCDNTRAAALREEGQEYRIRHTANSQMRIAEARDALNVVFRLGESFTKEIEQLLAHKVSDPMFTKFVERIVPLRQDASKTATTKAETDRAEFMRLWNGDPRVAPWKGTAFGAVQAVNTYRQHIRPTRGDTIRAERNMMDNLTGQTEVNDAEAFKKLLALTK